MIEERQERFTGHVFRMPIERASKQILTAQFPSQTVRFLDARRINWRKQQFRKHENKTTEEIEIYYSSEAHDARKQALNDKKRGVTVNPGAL